MSTAGERRGAVRSCAVPARNPLGRLAAKVRSSLGGADTSRPVDDDRTSTGGIDVSYAPDHDGDADPGEVVWAWVPYEDEPAQGKDRPVLVLGYDGPLLAAVPLSSKDHRDRTDAGDWVDVGRGAWDPAGRVSYADASRLLRCPPAEVRREGAALDEARFRAVLVRVELLHGWTT